MAPVARELVASSGRGVLEPLQTTATVNSQVEELRAVLEENGDPPVILIGHSWGAWLVFILAARHPSIVKNLVLISSPPFEEKYAAGIMATRLSRLPEAEQKAANLLQEALNNSSGKDRNCTFARLGELFSKADSYDPVPYRNEVIECQRDIYEGVWPEAEALRNSEELLGLSKRIQCPVVAIHGDYDPHPAAGVKEPLTGVLKDFRFILLENCGHTPWLERQAKTMFFSILKRTIIKHLG